MTAAEKPVVERWRPVADFHGYFVSDRGRVRSEKLGTPRLLATTLKRDGYVYVALSVNGHCVMRSVHSLVACAFLGPRPTGYDVAHQDGVRTNNAARNLRYKTRAENEADKVRHGTAQIGARHWRNRRGQQTA